MKWYLSIKIFVTFIIIIFSIFNFSYIEKSPNLSLSLIVIFVLSIFSLINKDKISVKSIKRNLYEKKETGLDLIFNHPAKMLIVYFLLVAFIGTGMLLCPFSIQLDNIKIVDAFFTAVSAVCVTGLTVLDTKNDFSAFGKFVILCLIQLGGLGIMSIASIALHTIGKISLRHEKFLSQDRELFRGDLKKSLLLIIKFTFIVEIIGACLLSSLFYFEGLDIRVAIWNGIFTSVSAFCNAGFFLESDNLIRYQLVPSVLYIISFLIILGGFAPATAVFIPDWIKGKKVSVHVCISIVITIFLLFFGTASLLFFEWNNSLDGLSVLDKINNAWFMSASLRTAGFNSIDISNVLSPTIIIMCFLMFVGGNPGGTAGGIKTTTFAVLFLAFWKNIRNKDVIIVNCREIKYKVVISAITIFIATLLVFTFLLFMLLVTQSISTKSLIFEVTSALGTVGLSLGITQSLDEIGKIIIIFAMFIGRIGSLTLFTLLGDDKSFQKIQYPPAKISLT